MRKNICTAYSPDDSLGQAFMASENGRLVQQLFRAYMDQKQGTYYYKAHCYFSILHCTSHLCAVRSAAMINNNVVFASRGLYVFDMLI